MTSKPTPFPGWWQEEVWGLLPTPIHAPALETQTGAEPGPHTLNRTGAGGHRSTYASNSATGLGTTPPVKSQHLRLETTVCRYKELKHKGSAGPWGPEDSWLPQQEGTPGELGQCFQIKEWDSVG